MREREIKFRAWEKITSRWADWDEIGITSSKYKGVSTFRPDWNDTRKEFEIQQFSGLKDKTGKELYEGDIVKDDFQGRIMLVEWWRNGFCFKAISETNFKRASEMWQWDEWENGDVNLSKGTFEIIGNIYENPELVATKDAHDSIASV